MFFHFSGGSKVTRVYKAVQQSRTIRVYVSPFWFCFLNFITVDRAEICHMNKEHFISVTEPARLLGSYEVALNTRQKTGENNEPNPFF